MCCLNLLSMRSGVSCLGFWVNQINYASIKTYLGSNVMGDIKGQWQILMNFEKLINPFCHITASITLDSL